jgi:hypothetical protein
MEAMLDPEVHSASAPIPLPRRCTPIIPKRKSQVKREDLEVGTANSKREEKRKEGICSDGGVDQGKHTVRR